MDIEVQDTGSVTAAPTLDHRSRRRLLGAGIVGLAGSLLPQLASRAAASTPPGTGSGQNGAGSGGAGSGGAGAVTGTEAPVATGDIGTVATDAAPTASAATTTTAPPMRPTEADGPLLGFAQSLELAAVGLYDQALAGDALGDDKALFVTLREAHLAYAQVISAMMGKGAPDAALEGSAVDDLATGFSGSKDQILEAAHNLEATALATHTDLVGRLRGTDPVALLASILIAEARHCTVLADMAGATDLDTLLLTDAPALEMTEG